MKPGIASPILAVGAALALAVILIDSSGCGRPAPDTPPPEESAAIHHLLTGKYVGPRYFSPGSSTADREEGGPWLDLVEARLQVAGVAPARHLGPEGTKHIEKLLDQMAEPHPSRAVGGKRLNLLRLNMALDEVK